MSVWWGVVHQYIILGTVRSSYPCKIGCWKRFGIQGSNYTYSFHLCLYNTDCIHLYPEHIHLCLYGGKLKYKECFLIIQIFRVIVSCPDWIFSYPHKFCCSKRFGIQGSSCTHSFHWCWYNSDCIHLHPERIHQCLYGGELFINILF